MKRKSDMLAAMKLREDPGSLSTQLPESAQPRTPDPQPSHSVSTQSPHADTPYPHLQAAPVQSTSPPSASVASAVVARALFPQVKHENVPAPAAVVVADNAPMGTTVADG